MPTGERKPVAPFYAVGALWLLSGALLPLYAPLHYGILAAISVLVFLLVSRLCRSGSTAPDASAQPQPAPSGEASELEQVLRSGAESLAEMKRLNDRIAAPGISADISQLEQLCGKIFQSVRDDPSDLPRIHRFLDYFLPTTLKLLRNYERMSSTGVSGENIDKSLAQIEAMMRNIVGAFAKQLDSLYGNEALDISTDIKVLEAMMAREGLSPASPEPSKPDGGGIHLEL